MISDLRSPGYKSKITTWRWRRRRIAPLALIYSCGRRAIDADSAIR